MYIMLNNKYCLSQSVLLQRFRFPLLFSIYSDDISQKFKTYNRYHALSIF